MHFSFPINILFKFTVIVKFAVADRLGRRSWSTPNSLQSCQYDSINIIVINISVLDVCGRFCRGNSLKFKVKKCSVRSQTACDRYEIVNHLAPGENVYCLSAVNDRISLSRRNCSQLILQSFQIQYQHLVKKTHANVLFADIK